MADRQKPLADPGDQQTRDPVDEPFAGVWAVLRRCLQWTKTVLHYLVLIRVPLTMGLILLSIAILGVWGPPAVRSVVSGLEGVGLFLSAVFLVFSATLVAHTGVLIWENAPQRFHARELRLPEPGWHRALMQTILVVVLSGPLLVLVVARRATGAPWWLGVAGALAAIVVVAGVVFLTALVRGGFPQTRVGQRVSATSSVQKMHSVLGPGYSDTAGSAVATSDKWRLGHVFSTLLALVLVSIYGIVGMSSGPGANHQLPALVFVLLLLMAFGSVFAGATFFLDRYRIPLTAAVLVWIVGSEASCPRPHTVLVAAPSAASADASLIDDPSSGAARDRWRLRGADPVGAMTARGGPLPDSDDRRVLTVITAAGGGIQASAWTVQVLVGLQQDLGPEFTRSIHLLSAVSGGATGTFLFVESIDPASGTVPEDLLEQVVAKAMEPSLAEAGWGLAFADVVRAFTPFLIGRDQLHRDRGWAMEQAWRQDAAWLRGRAVPGTEGSSSLQEWADAAVEGSVPGVIFGSTIVDDGQQALFSNLDLRGLGGGLRKTFGSRSALVADPGLVRHYPSRQNREGASSSSGAKRADRQDDSQLPSQKAQAPGGQPNLPASTAARLSATFPWVSPIARIDLGTEEKVTGPGYHFADGGYFDNFGTMAAVQWLRLLVSKNPEALAKYEEILFIEVNGFPLRAKEPPNPESSGLLYSIAGPLKAMLAVRTSSQLSRGVLELDLLQKSLDGLNQTREKLELEPLPELRLFEVRMPNITDAEPPLSWQLSQPEKASLREAWRSLRASGELCRLAVAFSGKSSEGLCPQEPTTPGGLSP